MNNFNNDIIHRSYASQIYDGSFVNTSNMFDYESNLIANVWSSAVMISIMAAIQKSPRVLAIFLDWISENRVWEALANLWNKDNDCDFFSYDSLFIYLLKRMKRKIREYVTFQNHSTVYNGRPVVKREKKGVIIDENRMHTFQSW